LKYDESGLRGRSFGGNGSFQAVGDSVGEGVGFQVGGSDGCWLGLAVVGDDVGAGGASGSLSIMRSMVERSGCLIPWRGSMSFQDLPQTMSGSKSRLTATVRNSLDMFLLFMGERISRQSQRSRSGDSIDMHVRVHGIVSTHLRSRVDLLEGQKCEHKNNLCNSSCTNKE
jgi:hypothetical protein